MLQGMSVLTGHVCSSSLLVKQSHWEWTSPLILYWEYFMELILHSWPGFTMEQRLQPTVPVAGSLWTPGEQNWTYPIPLALMVGGTQYEWVHWIFMVIETADKTPCGFHHWNTTQYMLQSHTFSWNKASWSIYHKSVCSDVYRSSVPRDYIDRATFSMFAAFLVYSNLNLEQPISYSKIVRVC